MQWAGFTDSPITSVISMFGPTINQPMGLGGYIMHDATGPTSRTSISFTYAYNYAIAEDMKISMGLAVGAFQYKIDGSRETATYDPVQEKHLHITGLMLQLVCISFLRPIMPACH